MITDLVVLSFYINRFVKIAVTVHLHQNYFNFLGTEFLGSIVYLCLKFKLKINLFEMYYNSIMEVVEIMLMVYTEMLLLILHNNN